MAKIIQFRLPSLAASGNAGFESPVNRDNPPPHFQKEPIVISVMPDKPSPPGIGICGLCSSGMASFSFLGQSGKTGMVMRAF
jgi:hypothetical protein